MIFISHSSQKTCHHEAHIRSARPRVYHRTCNSTCAEAYFALLSFRIERSGLMSKKRLVIRDLKQPSDAPCVQVGTGLSPQGIKMLSLWLTLLAIVFSFAETWYFGWNFRPASTAEKICDYISLMILGLAFISLLMSWRGR